MDVSVQTFNRYMADNVHHDFIEDVLLTITKLHDRIKALHQTYGRGALLIHFKTVYDHKAKTIQNIKEVLHPFNHPILYAAVKTDPDAFIINDQMLWLPIKCLDLYFKVSQASSLRFYPLCTHFVTMQITYKDKDQWNLYYHCTYWPSFQLHPKISFKLKYTKFISTIKRIKLKYFKKKFPIFYEELLSANKIKQYPINLITYSWPLINFVSDDSDYNTYCKSYPDDGKYPFYTKLIGTINGKNHAFIYMVKSIVIREILSSNIVWELPVPNIYKYMDQWNILNQFDNVHKAEWALKIFCKFYQQLNALTRLMIRLYGSKCSYCNKIAGTIDGKRDIYKKCSNCFQRYYCTRKCQKLDWNDEWKGHRKYCEMYKKLISAQIRTTIVSGKC